MFITNKRWPDDNANKLFRAQTRAAVERQLNQRVAALREMTIGHIIYLDTITLLSQQPIALWIEQRLRRTTSGTVKVFTTKARGWRRGLWIQQPEDETIACLSDYIPDHIIARCDISLDLLTRDQAAADEFYDKLRSMLTQPWRGRRMITTVNRTVYYGSKQTRRNIAIYPTRPSKVTFGPAVHVDFRYCGAAACRQRGINHAMDLIAFDPNKLLERDLRLSTLHWKVVDKRIDKEAHRLARYNRIHDRRPLPAFINPIAVRRRIERMILVQVSNDEELLPWNSFDLVPVQSILDAAGSILRDAAVHIPGKCLISPQVGSYHNLRSRTVEKLRNPMGNKRSFQVIHSPSNTSPNTADRAQAGQITGLRHHHNYETAVVAHQASTSGL